MTAQAPGLGTALGQGPPPMGMDMGSCVIPRNRAFHNGKPHIVRAAGCANDRVPQATYRWAMDHAMGGFEGRR